MSSQTPKTDCSCCGLLERNHFLLRRLHSLSGLLPVGMFLCFHLFTNMQMILGQKNDGSSHFQKEVDWIHNGLPAMEFIELSLFAAIAFHAIFGVWYAVSGNRSNVGKYGYFANIRYFLQRVTAWIVFLFILFHVLTLRYRIPLLGELTPFYSHGGVSEGIAFGEEVKMSLPWTAYALQTSVPVLIFYVIGMVSATFHLANGLWTMAITWGVTLSKGGMKRWGQVCAALFAGLTGLGFIALFASVTFDLNDITPAQKAVMIRTLDKTNDNCPVFQKINDQQDQPEIKANLAKFDKEIDDIKAEPAD